MHTAVAVTNLFGGGRGRLDAVELLDVLGRRLDERHKLALTDVIQQRVVSLLQQTDNTAADVTLTPTRR